MQRAKASHSFRAAQALSFFFHVELFRRALHRSGHDFVNRGIRAVGSRFRTCFMNRLFEYFESEYLKFNMDTGNSFIAGLDPVEYLKIFRKYLSHAHIKDVSQGLAAAVRGEETGIATSEVPIGGGVNADNIKGCLEFLKETDWDGAISIECNGADHNIRQSVEFLRGLLA